MGQKKRVLLIHNYGEEYSYEDTIYDREKDLLKESGYAVYTFNKSNGTAIFIKSAIKKVIEKNRIEIIHIYNLPDKITESVATYGKEHGIKIVKSIHNHKYMSLANGISKYIVSSELEKDIISGKVEESKIEFKPNFTSKAVLEPYGLDEREWFVYFDKEPTIQVVEYLTRVWESIQCETLLICCKEENKLVQNHIKDNNIKNVEVVILNNEKEYYKILSKSKGVIMPIIGESLDTIVCMDAFSHGTPVIYSSSSIVEELMENKKNGLEFDINNEQDLVQKINLISNCDEIGMNLIENSYDIYKKKYSTTNNYKVFREIYGE